jgi:hypothetical protein
MSIVQNRVQFACDQASNELSNRTINVPQQEIEPQHI